MDETVGMLAFVSILPESIGRKVLQVERDDDINPSANRRSKYMTIVRVGKRETLNQVLVPGHEAIPHVDVHEIAGTLELLSSKVGADLEDACHPFFVNLVCPLGTEEVGEGQVHQQVAQRGGIEHTGIVENRQSAQGS